MDDLAAFAAARLDEAEPLAGTELDLRFIRAARAILAEHAHERGRSYLETPDGPVQGCVICGLDDGVVFHDGWCKTVRHLAAIWDGHPGYRPEWKP